MSDVLLKLQYGNIRTHQGKIMRFFFALLITAFMACSLTACNEKSKENIKKEDQVKNLKGQAAADEYQRKLRAAAKNVGNL